MSGWLTSTWEPNWKSFQYFNVYRLILAAVLVAMGSLSQSWISPFIQANPLLFNSVGIPYILTAGFGAILSVRWHRHFNFQLSLQVLADVVAVTLLMYGAGGLNSGFGILLLVSLAAASLVGQGQMVLFYAAFATLAVLLMQLLGVVRHEFDPASLVQAGLLSLGYFATAILARLLGQRMMAQEDLARRRGVALENQSRISQRIIERMQDGVLIADRSGRVLRCNPVAANMLGAAARPGSRLADYSADLFASLAAWVNGLGRESVVFSGDRERDIQARFEFTDSSDGEILVFLEDVGRLKEQAQQLKLASLGRLTASIAHEIRNPLASISHASDLLQEENRGEVQNRLHRILRDNVSRLDRIVQDVLDLGRSDRAHIETLRLDHFVRDFAAEFSATKLADQAVLAVAVEGPVEICFDRSHLRQVLWNLAANAVRHCQGGAGSVRLSVPAPKDAGRVELHVLDDGPGVPEAIRTQVFEPFFTTHHKGTGLGLFIARELCEANGASLELGCTAVGGHFVISGRNDRCQTQERNAASAAI